MRKVSIVMTHHNRVRQLFRTLRSIERFCDPAYTEVIIVDDASNSEHRVTFLQQFNFKSILIEVDENEKWYVNPCIPFNRGFRQATGDIVVIQNAECLHMGNVFQHLQDHLTENDYFSYGAYSLPKDLTLLLDKGNWQNADVVDHLAKTVMLENRRASFLGGAGWYNHSIHRPAGYHFLSALTRKNLEALDGFDERYAMGNAWDDDEFLFRATSRLKLSIWDTPFVIHQWHYSTGAGASLKPPQDNGRLFREITVQEILQKYFLRGELVLQWTPSKRRNWYSLFTSHKKHEYPTNQINLKDIHDESLICQGDDLSILPPNFKVPNNTFLIVYLDVRTPASTEATIYFQTKRKPEFDKLQSLTKTLRAGSNSVYFRVMGHGLLGAIRLVIGAKPGIFHLHKLEVRAVPFGL